jgi:hypothetical protein
MIQESEIAYIVASWRAVQEFKSFRKPERLAVYVQRLGGIEDPAGDVLNIVGTTRARPGLIRKAASNLGLFRPYQAAETSGRGLDDWALRAWEQGFLDGVERPTINDFLDALDRDINGTPVVRQDDLEALEACEAIADLEDDLGRIGVDATVRTEAGVRAAIDAYNRAVAGDGEDADTGDACEGASGLGGAEACVGA